jgi:hypothetical protein
MPPASPDELFAYLDSLGIAHQTVWHPPVFTVEEARGLRAEASGGFDHDCPRGFDSVPRSHRSSPADRSGFGFADLNLAIAFGRVLPI